MGQFRSYLGGALIGLGEVTAVGGAFAAFGGDGLLALVVLHGLLLAAAGLRMVLIGDDEPEPERR